MKFISDRHKNKIGLLFMTEKDRLKIELIEILLLMTANSLVDASISLSF